MKRIVLAIMLASAFAYADIPVKVKMSFMCRKADAELAGYDTSGLSTNEIGLVWVKGYCNALAPEGYTNSVDRGVVLFTVCTLTNITWNASTHRLESGDYHFTKD